MTIPKARPSAQEDVATPESTLETRLDRRYALRRVLASGGAAKVFAGEHVHTHRLVAVKVPHDTKRQTVERMQREIEVLARVRGAGVAEMWDAGDVDGVPYIVLELLEGRTLAGLLAARGRLGIEESIKVGVEVAQALGRCHDQGVVHRDVKPANLFVTTSLDPQVHLLDFGIAKLAEDGVPRAKLTQDHALLGTPEYMAPEALLALPTVDHRADIYGLGVTLFECLTGSVPFDGQYAELLLKLSTTTARPIEELRPDVPPALAKVLSRTLSRAVEERFQSMSELEAALRAIVDSRPERLDLLGHRPLPPASAAVGRETPTIADGPQAKSGAGGAARRRFPRAAYTALCRLALPDGSVVDGRVEEVSEGGMQFVGDRALEAGQSVRIRFALPASGRIVTVSATARWNRTVRGTNATGFEFGDLAEAARTEIRQYVAHMAPEARAEAS